MSAIAFPLAPPYADEHTTAELVTHDYGLRVAITATTADGLLKWPRFSLPLAHYLYQVDLWAREQRWLPEDTVVVPRNGVADDLRLDNLEAVAADEHVRRCDVARYGDPATHRLDLTQFFDLQSLLAEHVPWQQIAWVQDLLPSYLRYLVAQFAPAYRLDRNPAALQANLPDMRALLLDGMDPAGVGQYYGLTKGAMLELLRTALSDVPPPADRTRHHAT